MLRLRCLCIFVYVDFFFLFLEKNEILQSKSSDPKKSKKKIEIIGLYFLAVTRGCVWMQYYESNHQLVTSLRVYI